MEYEDWCVFSDKRKVQVWRWEEGGEGVVVCGEVGEGVT